MKKRRKRQHPFYFEWWAHRHGYEWISGNVEVAGLVRPWPSHDGAEFDGNKLGASLMRIRKDLNPDRNESHVPWLVAKAAPEGMADSDSVRIYEPLDTPALHRKLAEIKPDARSIQAFANRFGFLGDHLWLIEVDEDLARGAHRHTYRSAEHEGEEMDETKVLLWGEPLPQWINATLQLRVLLKLSSLHRDCTPTATRSLEEMLKFHEAKVAWLSDEFIDRLGVDRWFINNLLMGANLEPAAASYERPVLLRYAARTILRDVVTAVLNRTTSPRIDIRPGGSVHLQPNNLLGAAYASFAEELMGHGKALVKCSACGTWFPPEHGRQMYCDNRCKLRAYRQRKSEGGTKDGD